MSDTIPSDPLSPVLAWFPLLSVTKITRLPRDIPGIWIGNGLRGIRDRANERDQP
jgi:hypothetical protein